MTRFTSFVWLLLVLALAPMAQAQTATFTQTRTQTPTQTPTPERTPISPSTLRNYQAGNPTWVAASTDMNFRNDGALILVRNASGSDITVLVSSVSDSLLGRTGDITLTVPAAVGGASGFGLIPPLNKAGFNQRRAPDVGKVYLHFSSTTTVTVAAIRLQGQ